MRGTGCVLLALVLLGGCGGSKQPATWYGSVGPIVEQQCAVCHQPGNIAPFSLLTYGDAKPMLSLMNAALSSHQMPPFPPDTSDGCPQYDDTRIMSDADRQTVIDWINAGAPEGQPDTLPTPTTPKPLGDPTDSWQMPQPYTSVTNAQDDYRCFLIQPPPLGESYVPVQAVSVVPGNRQIVHHAAVYLVAPAQIPTIQAMEGQDGLPGYECFGGVGVEPAYPAGLWVPGNDQPLVPPYTGVGFYLPDGWAWVLQVHYNFTNVRNVPDQSTITMWRAPYIVEVPHDLALNDTDFTIPAGSTSTVVSQTGQFLATGQTPALTQTNEGQIYAVWAHEHLLGKTFQMDLVHADGSSQCLLHIPSWNFHWQSIYRLHDFVPALPGDTLQVKCEWANPGTTAVSYGETTGDEMCIGSVDLIDF